MRKNERRDNLLYQTAIKLLNLYRSLLMEIDDLSCLTKQAKRYHCIHLVSGLVLKEKERKEQALLLVKQAMEQCPQQIDLRDIKSEKEVELFKVIDNEGKNWWDFAETIVWNSRKKLIEMLQVYLPNERDLIPVLEAITKSRGWIKSTKLTITVKL